MKKIVWCVLFSIILVVACSLDKKTLCYDVMLSGNLEEDIFKESVEMFLINDFSIEEKPEANGMKVEVGNQEIFANHVAVKKYKYRGEKNVYLSEDKKKEYTVDTTSDSFFIKAQENTFLALYDEELLTETHLVEMAKAYLSNFVEDVNFEDYTYKCYTSLVVTNTNSAWSERRETFYLSEQENEEVTRYIIEFCEYCNGIPTSDAIIVIADAAGNITDCYYHEYGVNWSSVVVEEGLVEESVMSFLKEQLQSQYEINRFEIKTEQLTLVDEEIKLMVSVEVSLLTDENEFVVMCPLILDVDND